MPSGPPSSASARLLARDLGRQRADHALGRYGGLATTRSSARRAASGAKRSPASTVDAIAEPERAHVVARRPRGRRGQLDRQHRGARAARRERAGDGSRCRCRRRRRAAGASRQALAAPTPRAPRSPGAAPARRESTARRRPWKSSHRRAVLQRLAARAALDSRGSGRPRLGSQRAGSRYERRTRPTPSSAASSHSASGRAALDPGRLRARLAARASSAGTDGPRRRPITARSPPASGSGPVAQRVDQLVEIALQHRGQPVQREADAVIGDALLGEVVGADLLAALARADLARADPPRWRRPAPPAPARGAAP